MTKFWICRFAINAIESANGKELYLSISHTESSHSSIWRHIKHATKPAVGRRGLTKIGNTSQKSYSNVRVNKWGCHIPSRAEPPRENLKVGIILVPQRRICNHACIAIYHFCYWHWWMTVRFQSWGMYAKAIKWSDQKSNYPHMYPSSKHSDLGSLTKFSCYLP